jgi:hypothetical protein
LNVLLLFAQFKMHNWWLVTWLDFTCNSEKQHAHKQGHKKIYKAATFPHFLLLPGLFMAPAFKETTANKDGNKINCLQRVGR